jgi:hypothetical protein
VIVIGAQTVSILFSLSLPVNLSETPAAAAEKRCSVTSAAFPATVLRPFFNPLRI